MIGGVQLGFTKDYLMSTVFLDSPDSYSVQPVITSRQGGRRVEEKRHHRLNAKRTACVGLTLIELVATVAVLSLLLAVSLPAVQSARESARQAQCANNLRNLGIALQEIGSISRVAEHDLIVPKLMRQCPSDPTGADSMILPESIGNNRRASADYKRTFGIKVLTTTDRRTRIVRGAWWVSFARRKIADGLSNTFAFVETAGRPNLYQSRPSNHELGFQDGREIAGVNDFPRLFHHHDFGAEHPVYSGMDINRTNSGGIYAFHGGANVAMCDGSVRFKPEGTDPEIMVAQFSRNEGEHHFVTLAPKNMTH